MATEEKNKVKEIVEILKKDGIEAGKSQSDNIVTEAKKKADKILKEAKEEREKIINEAREEAEKRESSAEANIRMAISQGINKFKEAIENELLQPTISETVKKSMDSDTVKNIILTIVEAYAKSEFSTNDLSIILGKDAKKQVKDTLLSEIDKKLEKSGSIEISDERIPQGVKFVQKNGNLSLEFTPESISEVLLSYIRPEFRQLYFKEEK